MFYQTMLRALLIVATVQFSLVQADDWSRFRGPSGNGVATDSDTLPSKWSPKANLFWKTELPGPGASSPIIVGEKVFITCYSGYGLQQQNPGDIKNLTRHLVCIDLASGKKVWQRDVKAALPEDPYSGIGVTAHGYASHTPVSDGESVYAFFGKSGIHAFDLDGKPLWSASVGMESDPAKWGSSSSPVIYNDTVIVTASAESQSIVGFNKKTGKEIWRQEAKGLDGMWGTPAMVKIDDKREDLVMCVARELWGMNPDTGKLRWYAKATDSAQAYSSVVMDGKRVYAVTGRGGGSVAIDAGGSGDISSTNTVWEGRDNASFASPVRHENKLYSVSRGIVTVIDIKTGERLQRLRLKGVKKTGGRFGSLDYPSPVMVGDRLFYMNGSGQMFVFRTGDELQQIAVNEVTNEKEIFWGSPAVSNGKMVIRSQKYLYCVADKGEEVAAADSEVEQPEEASPEQAGEGDRQRGGRRQFDPMAMFNQMDSNDDGKIAMSELEGNRMAERLKTLDKDGDEAISKDEFTTGISTLFRRRGSGGGSGGYGRGGGTDNRPDRPQRPEFEENGE